MKIYGDQNVFDAALDRFRYLFDEFPNVFVCFSGGKDSVVCLEIARIVAREKNRLPLNVMWIDQEAEWQGTVDICEKVMLDPEVKPFWYQMPIVITNNASSFERYFYCWGEDRKDKWIHDKHPLSIKENIYGTVRFHDLFRAIMAVEFKGEKACYIAGVRTEETPKRYVGLTTAPVYKWITWGRATDKKKDHYTFYPIYDWEYTDIWKAINDNGWAYNRIYDKIYQYGLPVSAMRISSVHHETSKQVLQYIQEIEPDTWERIVAALPGANTIGQMKKSSFVCPMIIPPMFKSWEEYAEYLNENIVQEEKNRALIKREMVRILELYTDPAVKTKMLKEVINTILSSDWDLTKIRNRDIDPDVSGYRQYKRGKKMTVGLVLRNPYIPAQEKAKVLKIYEDSNGTINEINTGSGK